MYDVVVIGCGPGGYAAAIRASQLGAKVAVIEAGEVGGACVNRGCLPTKAWLSSVHALYWIRRTGELGIKASVQGVDFKGIVARKDEIIAFSRMGMEGVLGSNGVEIIRGRGRLKSHREVEVSNKVLETKKVIVATGSQIHTPKIPGLGDAAWTTDQVLNMAEVPSSVLIMDSGPVEIEMATLLNMFGCKVTLVSKHSRILPGEDRTCNNWLAQALKQQGISLIYRSELKSVKKSNGMYQAVLSGQADKIVEIEKVLVSSRKPNTTELGLENVGIRLNESGAIRVNERLESTVQGIFAIGDVIGGSMLANAAESMGVIAAQNAMGGTIEYPFQLVPRGIWSIPQLGAVGISEEEAKQQGIDYRVGSFPYSASGIGMATGEIEGEVKIISDSRYGSILGVHIVGPNATELIGEAVLAISLECTVDSLAYALRLHPTFSEAMVEASRDTVKASLYLRKAK